MFFFCSVLTIFFLRFYNSNVKIIIIKIIHIILLGLISFILILYFIEILNYKKIKKVLNSISIEIFYKYKKGNRWYIKMDIAILTFLLILFSSKIISIIICLHYECFKNKFYVPKELVEKLYRAKIKLLEDEKRFLKMHIYIDLLISYKKLLRELHTYKKISLDKLRYFTNNNNMLKTYFNLIIEYPKTHSENL